MTAESPTTRPAAVKSADGRRIIKAIWNRQFALGAALLAIVLFLQWPMLKGMLYELSGTEAPKSAIAWRDNFASARSEAAATGKPILLAFSASWCPACIVMEHEVWPDAAVSKTVNERFIPIHMNVDDPQHAAVTAHYEVRAIPTALIVSNDGAVLRRAASMSRSQTLRFLSETFAGNGQS